MNREEIQLMLNEERVKILATLDRALANQDRIKNIHIDLGRGVMSYVKEPPSGAAEIEPKPQDGRRIENRVAALAEAVQAGNEVDKLLEKEITDLQQHVQALTERVDANHEWSFRHSHLPNGLAVISYTPPQPAAPRIDPEDEELVNLIRVDLVYMPVNITTEEKAKRIVKTVASYLNGPSNG